MGPAISETKSAFAPKIVFSAVRVSLLATTPAAFALARIATFGASDSSVVDGLGTATLRWKVTPTALPAASRAATVAASFGKIREPAGVGPPVVETKDCSAISPYTPSRSRARIAFCSRTPWVVMEYQSDSPAATPPWSWSTDVTTTVDGAKLASPRGTSAVSAPHIRPWLQAPGGA